MHSNVEVIREKSIRSLVNISSHAPKCSLSSLILIISLLLFIYQLNKVMQSNLEVIIIALQIFLKIFIKDSNSFQRSQAFSVF